MRWKKHKDAVRQSSIKKIGEKIIIEIILEKLKEVFSEIIISANDYEKYDFLNRKIISDIYKERGPLAGIHSALKHSKHEMIFVSACDIPLEPIKLIQFLINFKSNCQIILPKLDGRIQFLCGIYSKSITPYIEQILNSNSKKGSLYELVENVSSEIIDISELNFNPDIFLNINTPDDFERIKLIFNKI